MLFFLVIVVEVRFPSKVGGIETGIGVPGLFFDDKGMGVSVATMVGIPVGLEGDFVGNATGASVIIWVGSKVGLGVLIGTGAKVVDPGVGLNVGLPVLAGIGG